MSRQSFYTTGCTNKNTSDLPAIIERHDAIVADIRLTVKVAFAAPPAELRRLLGLHYRRVAQFAARANKARETTVANLATGRRICTAETLNQAKAVFNEFLRLGVDWSRQVPWASDAEAHRLKERINRILLIPSKD